MVVAKAVRRAAEQLVVLGDAGNASDEDLEGACGDVSMVFAQMIDKVDCYEEGDFTEEDSYDVAHCWVRLDDEVWDLTATQLVDFVPDVTDVFVTNGDERYVTKFKGKKAYKSLCVGYYSSNFGGIIDGWGDSEWRIRLKERAKAVLEYYLSLPVGCVVNENHKDDGHHG
jgi:hypothetical protein